MNDSRQIGTRADAPIKEHDRTRIVQLVHLDAGVEVTETDADAESDRPC